MQITKIEISNYKSIKNITLNIEENAPIALIGKNGCGKTSILEALYNIFLYNSAYYYEHDHRTSFDYKIFIKLSKEDVKSLYPKIKYDEKKCILVAYNRSESGLKIDTVKSEYIVGEIRRGIDTIENLTKKLDGEIESYESLIAEKLKFNDTTYATYTVYGGGFNSPWMIRKLKENIRSIKEGLEKLRADFTLDEIRNFSYRYSLPSLEPLTVEYFHRHISGIEENYIKIDVEGLKNEIKRLNEILATAHKRINGLIERLGDEMRFLKEAADTQDDKKWNDEQGYKAFLDKIRSFISSYCIFFQNENDGMLFRVDKDDRGFGTNRSTDILRIYFERIYSGKDKAERIKKLNEKDVTLSAEEIEEFTNHLNKELPRFEDDMIDGVSVDSNGEIKIREKSGKLLPLDYSNLGRRWFFSYYFMKNQLKSGDWFLIDEPAANLYPTAQKEIMKDIIELAKSGVHVIYSTHNPYLIPDEKRFVKFVSLEKHTTVKELTDAYTEYLDSGCGGATLDVFALQEAWDIYDKKEHAEVAAYLHMKITEKGTLEKAAKEMGVPLDTLKDWIYASRKNNPEIGNILKLAIYLKTDLIKLLKCEK